MPDVRALTRWMSAVVFAWVMVLACIPPAPSTLGLPCTSSLECRGGFVCLADRTCGRLQQGDAQAEQPPPDQNVPTDTVEESCGNGFCQPDRGEGCTSCPSDCRCGLDLTCRENRCEACQCVPGQSRCKGDVIEQCAEDCSTWKESKRCEKDELCELGQCKKACGNGVCEADRGETCSTCLEDCGCSTGQSCENDACVACTCEPGTQRCQGNVPETCQCTRWVPRAACPVDSPCQGAGLCGKTCGDGTCEAARGETCASCPADCKCTSEQACLNGACIQCVCNPGSERCTQDKVQQCRADCSAWTTKQRCGTMFVCDGSSCKSSCGDGTCDANEGENCASCPDDCKCASGQTCQNAACLSCVCTPGQKQCRDGNVKLCASDCLQWLNLQTCTPPSVCQKASCVNLCGNGACDAAEGENCATCPTDCKCSANQTCDTTQNACKACTCQAGAYRCNGNIVQVCTSTCLAWRDIQTCGASQQCQNGSCQATCGNNVCDPGETCSSCPPDCKCASGQTCQNGACKACVCNPNDLQCASGIQPQICKADCSGWQNLSPCPNLTACKAGSCQSTCGNGACNAGRGENCATCSSDCKCAASERCASGQCIQCACTAGQTTCKDNLTVQTCRADCTTYSVSTCPLLTTCKAGSCQSTCGNGACNAGRGENCSNCPGDCKCASGRLCTNGTCQSCGNGTCEATLGENCSNCPSDCKCASGRYCQNGTCKPRCGNGLCEGTLNENCTTCPGDCPCPSTAACVNGQCTTSNACGNRQCEAAKGENCSTCSSDCSCPLGQRCGTNQACCGDTCFGNYCNGKTLNVCAKDPLTGCKKLFPKSCPAVCHVNKCVECTPYSTSCSGKTLITCDGQGNATKKACPNSCNCLIGCFCR